MTLDCSCRIELRRQDTIGSAPGSTNQTVLLNTIFVLSMLTQEKTEQREILSLPANSTRFSRGANKATTLASIGRRIQLLEGVNATQLDYSSKIWTRESMQQYFESDVLYSQLSASLHTTRSQNQEH